jgi:hypothetical protein
MRNLTEKGKCSSCGDYTEIYEYNKAKSCANCLGMDRRGITRLNILKKNTGKKKDYVRNNKRYNQ